LAGSTEYQSGICNIGQRQTRLRYLLGAIGFAAALLYVYWFTGSGLSNLYLLAAFFPLLIGFEGAIQGRMNFCATYGLTGLYDLRGSGGERGRVEDPEHRKEDREKALMIHGYSIVAAVLVTATLYLFL